MFKLTILINKSANIYNVLDKQMNFIYIAVEKGTVEI